MPAYPPPKTMARLLRAGLAERSVTVSHSTALELVARQLGFSDWNVLAARDTDPMPSPSVVVPEGWHASGRGDLFSHDLLPDAGPDGAAAILIESRAPAEPVSVAGAGEFFTVMQRVDASSFRGRIVSFRARLRCERATGSGRLWIHARGQGRETLASDNLGLAPSPTGPITGTTDWTRRTVTISVPEDALYLGFGVLFGSGTGRFMASDLAFGEAEQGEAPRRLPSVPVNLALARKERLPQTENPAAW
ncbi:glyoxalase superfamily protein [Acetobacteraceae bacterium KSS8]|uniref:Glyoxalase superfamily protein n=1 Tax=Endosaccharibacter trunci TaxID=2812733 RepID=A0ABT1W7B5_9PROT|nr:glyoxalase superfamily protein [Acetobacteraceae bacterium KSS8]